MQRPVRIVLWLCQALLALMFLAAGVGKFVRPMWAAMFSRWGYPDQFYLVVGAIEVSAGLALLVPRLAAPASLILLVVMMGAGLTHVVHSEQHRLPQIIIMSLLLGIVAYGRWSEVLWRRWDDPRHDA
jgi:uncharacterized membrane protein YphA (DoxX/SURF4 family)